MPVTHALPLALPTCPVALCSGVTPVLKSISTRFTPRCSQSERSSGKTPRTSSSRSSWKSLKGDDTNTLPHRTRVSHAAMLTRSTCSLASPACASDPAGNQQHVSSTVASGPDCDVYLSSLLRWMAAAGEEQPSKSGRFLSRCSAHTLSASLAASSNSSCRHCRIFSSSALDCLTGAVLHTAEQTR
eukprot:2755723-Rhodomonas_salina.2